MHVSFALILGLGLLAGACAPRQAVRGGAPTAGAGGGISRPGLGGGAVSSPAGSEEGNSTSTRRISGAASGTGS